MITVNIEIKTNYCCMYLQTYCIQLGFCVFASLVPMKVHQIPSFLQTYKYPKCKKKNLEIQKQFVSLTITVKHKLD